MASVSTSMTLDEARQCFRQFRGNHFFLHREIDEDRYLASGVTPELEQIWKNELFGELVADLQAGKPGASSALCDMQDGAALTHLVNYSPMSMDSHETLRYAQDIIHLIRMSHPNTSTMDERRAALDTAVSLLRRAAYGRYSVSDSTAKSWSKETLNRAHVRHMAEHALASVGAFGVMNWLTRLGLALDLSSGPLGVDMSIRKLLWPKKKDFQ